MRREGAATESMKIALAYFEKFIEMSGGIEGVCCAMANAMARRGHDVFIVYCYGRSGAPFYPLDESVKLYNLMAIHPEKWKNDSLSQCVSGGEKLMREILRVFDANKARDWNEKAKGRMIREEVRQVMEEIQPDVIVSLRFETGNYLLNAAEVTTPVVMRSYISPRVILPKAPAGEIAAIEKSAAAHVQLEEDIKDMKKFCPHAHVVCIPNAVPQYDRQADLAAEKHVYTILHAGRMNKEQKRQHLLVEAFARAAADFPNWRVELWGGGNESGVSYAEELRRQIHECGLDGRVLLKGESRHILDEYVKGDIFCFPSAYEGFPNALAEAMSAGLPPAAFRSCSGVPSLIRDGENGLLADDGAEALAGALRRLMENKELRVQMGQRARDSMRAYAPEIIWDQWEKLLEEAAEKRGNEWRK